MALFASAPRMSLTLRVLAHLLGYPDAGLRAHLAELRDALRGEAALAPPRLAEIEALIERLARLPALEAEAAYVELFDRGRGTALHLFEHVHGDSRERGPAMISLIQTYEQAGLVLAPGELPDYLPVVLEYASTQPPAAARAFLAEIAHLLRVLFSALARRGSAYASVPAALLELAGERAERVALPEEPPLDEAWAEPAAFDGCSAAGQSRPGQGAAAQPIQIVKPPRPATAQGARA
ncbi:MAG: nitrate reductase molybdenum cofactor assembly chaperone [Rubrivivax sp.]